VSDEPRNVDAHRWNHLDPFRIHTPFRQGVLMSDKALALTCFTIASMTDARITQFLIGLGIAAEGNPLMEIAMNSMPHGMWIIKAMVSLIFLLLLRKISIEFLIALTGGMCVVLAWNFGLLATWCLFSFAR
jgi:hypothetical protein